MDAAQSSRYYLTTKEQSVGNNYTVIYTSVLFKNMFRPVVEGLAGSEGSQQVENVFNDIMEN